MNGLTPVIRQTDIGPLVVGSYRCDTRSTYLDLQEFVEDSVFEFMDRLCHFNLDARPSLMEFTVRRQLNPDVIGYGQQLLHLIQADTFERTLDLPYLYTYFAPDFRVFIFDNGQSYLAVFVTTDNG